MARQQKVRPRPELRLRLHPSERAWHRQFTRQAIREYGSVSACLRAKLGLGAAGYTGGHCSAASGPIYVSPSADVALTRSGPVSPLIHPLQESD